MHRGDVGGLRQRALLLGGGVLAILALDQLTKLLISAQLELGQSVPVVPGLVHFTLVRNTGMAFGLLSAADFPYKTALVTAAAVLALGAVAYYALRSSMEDRATLYGLTFILGGAIGNIVDRLRLGYVVDFVDVFVGDAHWPAFNVADSSICVGVGLLLLDSLRRREPSLRREPGVAAQASRGDS